MKASMGFGSFLGAAEDDNGCSDHGAGFDFAEVAGDANGSPALAAITEAKSKTVGREASFIKLLNAFISRFWPHGPPFSLWLIRTSSFAPITLPASARPSPSQQSWHLAASPCRADPFPNQLSGGLKLNIAAGERCLR